MKLDDAHLMGVYGVAWLTEDGRASLEMRRAQALGGSSPSASASLLTGPPAHSALGNAGGFFMGCIQD